MPHDLPLISTIAVALGLALVMGFVAVRLKLPALVGYLLAGIVIGPATPGFVADQELASQLAEIGIILLMFGVGLHFALDDLLAVKRIALPGAVLQIAVATAMAMGVSWLWGWSWAAGLVFGLALSVASTVVLLRALEQSGQVESLNGRIAVGWLIVEDLAMVLVLVLLPPVAAWLAPAVPPAAGEPRPGLFATLLVTLAEVAAFVALMLIVGRRVLPWLLWQAARTGSRELFTLCVIATAMGIAFGSAKLFGVSFALGAFFAGMVMKGSPLSHRAAAESLPFRDAFSVLFFVAVGMLFDPAILVDHPLRVLTVVGIIVFGKSLAAFGLVLAFRYPLNTALTVSASLAQIGEFSFILAGLGLTLGVLPAEGLSLVLAGALFSIALNPLLFRALEPLQEWIHVRSGSVRAVERRVDPLAELPATVEPSTVTDHVVLVGYGRVGQPIAQALAARGQCFVVAEESRELVEELRAANMLAVAGDASEPDVLIQAHVARARMLVIAAPDSFKALKMLEVARALNPGIDTVVRTHSEQEAELLCREHAGRVFLGEHELARGMAEHILRRLAEPTDAPASGTS